MDDSYDLLDELEIFLGATFHQDIRSPEHALDEFIEEMSKEGLLFTVKFCEEFLNSDLTKEEKEDIIKCNAKIYFLTIGLSPIEWFKSVIEKLKGAI
ncbi:contact-dependent growth inhibition system immunity protein [Bacillus vallismortis]|uniref:contact-dependent growth inhibition system immunity protein n=1 Tax=Bacillus vallismortis TaxID=72361 RepID=UPI00228109DA|nr:contact-dependent growth inhibition system immunity protein [Bacillus vallismortis]MCY7892048.1 contact-dependent growth inhibition system immunity protein [Bacillus vallismortis]